MELPGLIYTTPIAVRWVKRCLDGEWDYNSTVLLENQAATACFVSQDQKEGLRAFLEKRAPVWSGG